MTETAEPALSLPAPVRDALVDLVVRGMHRGEPSAAQASLVELGLAVVKGPLLMPVGAASAMAGSLLRLAPGSPADDRTRSLLEAFLPVNRQLRDVCTAWQCRPGGSSNDHADAAYDAGVRDRLEDVHEAIQPVLDRLAAVVPGFGRYPQRLAAALDRLDDGEPAWLASPVLDSYHTVWMQLHQELLLCLGVSREEDEALEARLVADSAR